MSVDSRSTTPTPYRPPLSRAELYRAIPWLRAGGGVAFLSYSAITTIHGVGVDLAPFFLGLEPLPVLGIPWQHLLAGLAAALLISLVQWLTSEKLPLVYAIFLVLDARWTQWSIGPRLGLLLAYHLPQADPLLVSGLTFVLSWILAMAVARYGELLLFGKRQ